jgi:spore coat polysaccharide biosynthesis predicted glycosyltransferase SpsG|tara:strand:- start:11195 stop:12091 length:897 start_codon:yes stop_codon:yes gene_type:complete
MTKSRKKILLFTEFSKKIGKGHYYRSLQIKKKLSRKYKCEIEFNKSRDYIYFKIKKKKPALVIFDFKNYNHNLFKHNTKYIAFDNNVKYHKNLINLNPLTLAKKPYSGPDWYPYPDEFLKEKNKKVRENNFSLLITQGATDAFNNLNKILKCLDYLDYKKIRTCIIKIPEGTNLNIKNKNNIEIKKIRTIKKISNIFKNIDLAITGCGNFALEISFFGIPSVYVSSEKTEIKRGKLLQKNNLGKFYTPNNFKNIANELNRLVNNNNYYNKIVQKKLKIFRKKGLSNILKLVDGQMNEI